MSLSNRRQFLALLAVPMAGGMLSGCALTPAYAPGGAAAGMQGQIRVDDPTDKNAFDLVARLENRLGRPDAARYALSYSIATQAVGVGITPENAITRFNLTGTVDWALKDDAGQTVTSGRANSFTAYSATGSTVAGLAAEEAAALRLMQILADQIVTRLIATAGDWA